VIAVAEPRAIDGTTAAATCMRGADRAPGGSAPVTENGNPKTVDFKTSGPRASQYSFLMTK
jgi:hypothetical protein